MEECEKASIGPMPPWLRRHLVEMQQNSKDKPKHLAIFGGASRFLTTDYHFLQIKRDLKSFVTDEQMVLHCTLCFAIKGEESDMALFGKFFSPD